MENNTTELKVIIIGGSIAGLTLARCLDHAGIDYVVLEKHNDIQTNIGGSIGLTPNGCRILDQLEIYCNLEKYTSPIRVSHMVFPDGYTTSDLFPTRLLERFGYPLSILTRCQLLEVLSASLQDLSKVKTGSKAVRIQPGETPNTAITVYTDDGQHYSGDVVVGADGVHSLARSEMWRLAHSQCAGVITKTTPNGSAYGMRVEYMCIFGISSPVDEIAPGAQIVRCYGDLTFLIFPGREGTVPWFAIVKLEKSYVEEKSVRWTCEEIRVRAEGMAHLQIWRGIRFRDIWIRTPIVSSTPLQEGLLQTWTCNRVVCIGDSVSKLTPNIAQGANLAIESAAALANVLYQLKGLNKPSATVIQDCLDQYVRNHHRRLRGIHPFSNFVTRVQSRQGYLLPLLSRYIYPWSGELTFYLVADIIARAVALEYLYHSGAENMVNTVAESWI
ncbi:hypothetical protein BDV06DRAFT_217044 [Aspergillus oleicola]